MGKNKKLPDWRMRMYYKGPTRRPTKEAQEEEMKVISAALIECLPMRTSHAFKCSLGGEQRELQLIVGLSSSLRHLKRKQTKALIYDSTATDHLANFLLEFAHKLDIPILKAKNLLDVAPKVQLKTLLVISLVEVSSHTEDKNIHKQPHDPKPKPVQSTIELDSFNRLMSIVQGMHQSQIIQSERDPYEFVSPETVKVKSTGKSQAKKVVKRAKKQSDKVESAAGAATAAAAAAAAETTNPKQQSRNARVGKIES